MKAPTKRVPEACIRQSGAFTWCSREHSHDEFLFIDAQRAIEVHGSGSDHPAIRCCPQCEKEHKRMMGSSMKNLQHSSTAGIFPKTGDK